MKSYQHVSDQERFDIWQARRTGSTQVHIAKALGHHPSTISRDTQAEYLCPLPHVDV